jgi:predicted RNA-binding Zn-ribbon protein involved in translation (DUF1610 family)
MNLLLFPLLLHIGGAGNIEIDPKIAQGLARRKLDPETINKILFQYRLWKYIHSLDNCCQACGAVLRPDSKSTTQTCGARCHKVIKRCETAPMDELKQEARKRIGVVESYAGMHTTTAPSNSNEKFPWHLVNDGWKYALHD